MATGSRCRKRRAIMVCFPSVLTALAHVTHLICGVIPGSERHVGSSRCAGPSACAISPRAANTACLGLLVVVAAPWARPSPCWRPSGSLLPRGAPVVCFAYVTNTMGRHGGDDFEKGEADKAVTALRLIDAAARMSRDREALR